ncbi:MULTISPECIES: TniQ family protein [unclassified Ruegeria]|uniref:TniQ family protein n=1 Tax=unclassified Ruegeria TaxID=2625375 RepID=UPI001ADCA734|nr:MULTISPECIES: TniQ family protein [unclassified Ruegeria]MBO9410764.1 TniQ family protein [Ruegeria sp. R8_1]MBO9414965.1 TniQ family protein [Ruegeria sp. R8_2]
MNRLALTLHPAALETPTSFLSRLAARNGCPDMVSFCSDLGLDLIAVSRGEEAALEHLCCLAGLPKDTFAKTAVVKTTNERCHIGHETFKYGTFSRPEVRVCPKCLLEQHQASPYHWEKIYQFYWQIPQIERCYLHNESLLTVARKSLSRRRFDTSLAIKDAWDAIQRADHPMIADSFDDYLSRRLIRGRGQSLCDQMSIPLLSRIAEALGVILIYGRSQRLGDMDCHAKRQALLKGFEVLMGGENDLFGALTEFSKRTERKWGRYNWPHFGALRNVLCRDPDHCEGLGEFRELMHRYVVNSYPVPAGTLVFGKEVEKRRVHTLTSARKHLKVRRDLFEEILLDSRLGHRDENGAFVLDGILTVETVEGLREVSSRFLSRKEVAGFLGISENVVKELQKRKLLRPRTGQDHWERKGYDAEYLQGMLDRIFKGTRVFRTAPRGSYTISNVTRRTQCRVADIVELILSGNLVVKGRIGQELALRNLLVSKAGVSKALSRRPRNGFTKEELVQRWSMGRPNLNRLIETGVLRQKRMKHSRSRVTGMLVPAEDVEAYERDRRKDGDRVFAASVEINA